MKNKITILAAPVSSPVQQTDTTKLVSLLALATGAVVMPQTGSADIIYTDLSSSPALVGYAGGVDSFLFGLPGTANFGFQRFEFTAVPTQPYGVSTRNYRTVVARDLGTIAQAPGKIQGQGGFAAPQPFGVAWDQGLGLFYSVPVGVANSLVHNPASGYDHQYLAWQFKDSTQIGTPLRYGWVEISLSIANYNAGGPNVTIFGYAYDNTGVKPTMGQQPVPEPTSMALMVLGAMTLGARGLRSWRRNRDMACQAC